MVRFVGNTRKSPVTNLNGFFGEVVWNSLSAVVSIKVEVIDVTA